MRFLVRSLEYQRYNSECGSAQELSKEDEMISVGVFLRPIDDEAKQYVQDLQNGKRNK